MAKKQTTAPETGLEEFNDSLTRMTSKVEENKKMVMVCTLVVLAIAAVILAYVYFFRTPGIQRANDQIGAADLVLAQGNDSTALAQYRDIADNSSYQAANRAALQTAILLYRAGNYEEALRYAQQYDQKDNIIGAAAYSLQGDCLVNLDRLPEAEKAFREAIRTSDHNPAYTPFFMLKLARVYRAQANFTAEAELLQELVTEYPLYGQEHNIDVQKLLDRAQLQMEAQ